jgi:hypothetical protein
MHPALRDGHLRKHTARVLSRLLEVRVILHEDVGDHDICARSGQRQRILSP